MTERSSPRQGLLSSRWLLLLLTAVIMLLSAGVQARASEADLAIPDLWKHGSFKFGESFSIPAGWLLLIGSFVICGTLGISLWLFFQIRKLPAHKSMLDVAEIIFQTCKTYLIQQGKFLLMLFVIIAVAMSYYLLAFGHEVRFEVTDETTKAMAEAGVPEDVVNALQPLKDQKALSKEEFEHALAGSPALLLPSQWDKYETKILTSARPEGDARGARFEVTEAAVARMKEVGVPEDVINALQPIKGRGALSKEEFERAVGGSTGLLSAEQLAKYKEPVMTHAHPKEWPPVLTVILVLLFSVVGMGGSYAVAWYGIRLNTYANARTAFASLKGEPWDVVNIPLRSGMSIGLFLISLELVMMVVILLAVPREIVGFCFLGFAIGESLGASALRIAGGIFTKIADIGSDLMKIVFNVKEDDPRNPGVIADCTGDNAGDSVGPTADGFETYGVTGVALISFIVLAIPRTQADLQATLIVWIFAMRFLMDFMSGVSYFVNQAISEAMYKGKKEFDFEAPLTRLIWIASILCIVTSYFMSWLLIGNLEAATGRPTPTYFYQAFWFQLATIISCGTLAAVLIPEFTKIFTSSHSKHVHEIVTASREGGASLTILSGLVAGNFSAFWKGMLIMGLMTVAFGVSLWGLNDLMQVELVKDQPLVGVGSIFAFGLVAFGFLCMGPVNIAVDSYGPVTDNAQSVFELAQTEQIPNIKEEIKRDFGFEPDFERGKHYLEANDSAGNTFKATAKPVLIGTAVVGATTMIFSIILLMGQVIINGKPVLELSLYQAPVLLGFITGGAVIFWFSGASMQAVTTGAYSAVEYIKKNMDLTKKEADIEDSKTVVRICTEYAQKGMWNIFIALMTLTLAFAFFDPNFFIAYLISIAVFGLFQAIYMANAGGSWDNAKKLVEVDLKEKGTALHSATVVGDTVGDPFKDTTSVALNPIIKFSTLFGLLAVEIAVQIKRAADPSLAAPAWDFTPYVGAVLLVVGLYFVWRSFYAMRIPPRTGADAVKAPAATH